MATALVGALRNARRGGEELPHGHNGRRSSTTGADH
jgi:hypothetical protein